MHPYVQALEEVIDNLDDAGPLVPADIESIRSLFRLVQPVGGRGHPGNGVL